MDAQTKTSLTERFGTIPPDKGSKHRTRLHQGWWRTNVLNESPGPHPNDSSQRICNTIIDGHISENNFLTHNTFNIVNQTLENRKKGPEAGIMEPVRLYNNLLSSQPLCFNFFGELKADTDLGLKILKKFYPNLTKLRRVIFEYAPVENYTNDNSAFDIAFEVQEKNRIGLIGWECKYTDSFSPTPHSKKEYENIFHKSNAFKGPYEELKKSRTNQLFRNQLIAESLKQNEKYAFVYTGLFCLSEDLYAMRTADYFKGLLDPLHTNFQIISYTAFIRAIQMLDVSWKIRQWSMLLWVRYCATVLSNPTVKQFENPA